MKQLQNNQTMNTATNTTKQTLEVSFFNHRKQCYYVGTSEQLTEYYKGGATEGLTKFENYVKAMKFAGQIKSRGKNK